MTEDQPFSQQPEDRSALTGKRAVIVEDELITQRLLENLLTKYGLIVVGTAKNGQEGVEMVLRERPDIVLMDFLMPVMDGLEAAQQILESYPVCIVMLTSFTRGEHLEKAQQSGTCGYIGKPFTRESLKTQLEAAYQAYNRPAEHPQ